MEKSPSKILQEHMIVVDPEDPRTTEEVVRDMVNKGVIPHAPNIQLSSEQITGAMNLFVPLSDIVTLEASQHEV